VAPEFGTEFGYHTPEVPEDLKDEARRSAMERRKKIYELASEEVKE